MISQAVTAEDGVGFLKRTLLQVYYRFISDPVAEGYRKIAALCRDREIPVLVAVFPPEQASLSLPAETIRLSRDLGFLVADLAPAYDALGREKMLMDETHPTAFGHHVAAEEVFRYLRQTPGTAIPAMPGKPPPDFDGARAAFVRGEQALNKDNIPAAVRHFADAVKKAPHYDGLAAYALYLASIRLGGADAAATQYLAAREATAYAPENIVYTLHLVEVCRNARRFEEALNTARRAHHLAQQRPDGRWLPDAKQDLALALEERAGDLLVREDRPHKALALYREALDLLANPSLPLRLSEVRALAAAGRPAAAREKARTVVKAHPQAQRAGELLDEVLCAHFNTAERRACWEALRAALPESPLPAYFLARLALEAGEPARALALLEAALRTFPKATVLHAARGEALLLYRETCTSH